MNLLIDVWDCDSCTYLIDIRDCENCTYLIDVWGCDSCTYLIDMWDYESCTYLIGLNTSLLINSYKTIITINKSKDQKTSFKEAFMNLLLKSCIYLIDMWDCDSCTYLIDMWCF